MIATLVSIVIPWIAAFWTVCDSSQLNGSAYEADTCDLSVRAISDYDISTDISANFSRNNTVDSGGLPGKKQLHSLNCASLNVFGLKRRLHYPDLCEFVNKYDLFCVCETKLDKYDIIDLHGYTFISHWRKQKFIRKSGGLEKVKS